MSWANDNNNVDPINLNNPAPNTIVFDTTGAFSSPQVITLDPNLGPLALTSAGTPESIVGPGGLSLDGGNLVQVFNVGRGTTATIAGLTVSHGYSPTGGGAIDNEGTLRVNTSILSGDAATIGGAIFNNGSLTLIDCTLAGNSALLGGGIFNHSGATLTVETCTISLNSADVSGGGVYNQTGAAAMIGSSTLSGNLASQVGGGVDNEQGTVVVGDTIIAGNTAFLDGDVIGAFSSVGYNLVGDESGSSGFATAGDQVGTAAGPLNAVLGPLQDNGGPTPTVALLPGSPAIDAGSDAVIPPGIATDQRGLPRITNGAVDIGAFESRGFTISLWSGNHQQAVAQTPFAAPLVVTVVSPYGEPVAGGVVTVTTPGHGPSAIFPGGDMVAIDVAGHASAAAKADATIGSYVVTASASGVAGSSVAFDLANVAGPPSQLVIQTKPSATATAGAAFMPSRSSWLRTSSATSKRPTTRPRLRRLFALARARSRERPPSRCLAGSPPLPIFLTPRPRR